MLVGKPGHVTGERPGSGKDGARLERVSDASHIEQCIYTHTISNTSGWWDSLALRSGVESQPQMLPCQETVVLPVRSGSTGNSGSRGLKALLVFCFAWWTSS